MKRIEPRGNRRTLAGALSLLLLAPLLQAAGGSLPPGPAAPTSAEVQFYTRPLVKARLRLPESLQDFAVTAVKPELDDPSRFEVQVRFKAKTPFGGTTEHTAQFRMKRTASKNLWIVTAE